VGLSRGQRGEEAAAAFTGYVLTSKYVCGGDGDGDGDGDDDDDDKY
jgi:hypothetical protein